MTLLRRLVEALERIADALELANALKVVDNNKPDEGPAKDRNYIGMRS